MHVAIDAERMNVVSITITDENRHDTKEFGKVLHPVIGKAKEVYGDKRYDSRSNFTYLHNKGVRAVIPTRRNSRSLSRGSPARGRVVKSIREKGLEAWKSEVQYGKEAQVPDPGGCYENILIFLAQEEHCGELIWLSP